MVAYLASLLFPFIQLIRFLKFMRSLLIIYPHLIHQFTILLHAFSCFCYTHRESILHSLCLNIWKLLWEVAWCSLLAACRLVFGQCIPIASYCIYFPLVYSVIVVVFVVEVVIHLASSTYLSKHIIFFHLVHFLDFSHSFSICFFFLSIFFYFDSYIRSSLHYFIE